MMFYKHRSESRDYDKANEVPNVSIFTFFIVMRGEGTRAHPVSLVVAVSP